MSWTADIYIFLVRKAAKKVPRLMASKILFFLNKKIEIKKVPGKKFLVRKKEPVLSWTADIYIFLVRKKVPSKEKSSSTNGS